MNLAGEEEDRANTAESRALAAALPSLLQDKARLDWLERHTMEHRYGQELRFLPPERGNVYAGEPDYHFAGGFQFGDNDGEPYYKTVREAIDATSAPPETRRER